MYLRTKSVILGSIALSALSACSGSQQQQGQQQQPPVINVMSVAPTTVQLESSYPAIIKGKADIDIRPQVTGFITKVHVDEGQPVHKGQLLFTLDQVQFQAAVDQAQANVNSAQVAVDNAQIAADNQKRLYDKNIISESQYLTSANQLSQARAALSQARAALESAKKNMSYTVVTSPSDGIVGSIPSREGSLASPSMAKPLTTVSENSQMYAYFSFNEKDLLKLTDNGRCSLESRLNSLPAVKLRLANGEIYAFDGKIATVSGVIDSSTGAASVRALFPNDNKVLRSGSTGQVIIPQVAEDVILIPQKATLELQDRRYALTVNDSNKVSMVNITVLDNNDGQNFVVTGGLNPGDVVVVEGVGTKVKDGSVITPKQQQ